MMADDKVQDTKILNKTFYPLTKLETNSFIFVKPFLVILPEASKRNSISAASVSLQTGKYMHE